MKDRESRDHWDKEWMYARNSNVVTRASDENDSLVSGTGRFDEQLGVLRVSQAPAVLAFHPYTGQLVAAGRDTVTVWESVSGWKSVENLWNSQILNCVRLATISTSLKAISSGIRTSGPRKSLRWSS